MAFLRNLSVSLDTPLRCAFIALSGAALLLGLCVTSLMVGSVPLSLHQLFLSVTGHAEQPLHHLIVWDIRFPRSFLALVIGAGFGAAGASMQSFTRNPLADPGLIGVSAWGALGAVVVLYFGMAGVNFLIVMFAGLLGALFALCILLVITGQKSSSLNLILTGIGLTSLGGALTALLLNLAPNPFAAYEIVSWLFGSLKDRTLTHALFAAPLILLGVGLLASQLRTLDTLSFCDDVASSMGVNLLVHRLVIMVGVALITGAGVAVAGNIAFVGLVVPHLVRLFYGARPSHVFWGSLFWGAVMLLNADILTRLVSPVIDLKLGVLTSLIGAPVFLHILFKMRGRT